MSSASRCGTCSPKQVKWTEEMTATDRPHRVTIYLSLGAIFISIVAASISGAGWYEAHQSRQIAAAASKAVVSAISIKPEPITWAYATSQLDLTVVNLGRSMANNVIVKYKSSFFGLGYSTPEEPGAPMLIESLAPGTSYNFHIHIFTEQGNLDDKYVRDTATDEVNDHLFCFSTWMKGPHLPISTPFQPCNEYQKDFTIYDDPRP